MVINNNIYQLALITLILMVTACKNAPIRLINKSPNEIREYSGMTESSLSGLCSWKKGNSKKGSAETFRNIDEAISLEFESRGLNRNYCSSPSFYTKQAEEEKLLDRKKAETERELALKKAEAEKRSIKSYFIDGVEFHVTKQLDRTCFEGGIYKVTLNGQINEDTSFAMEKILSKTQHCKSEDGLINHFTTVALNSSGGLLEHGYKLGELFREKDITVEIEDKALCASSCAIAFLGGKKRVMGSNSLILFHAPYYVSENKKSHLKCTSDKSVLGDLEQYYKKMIGNDDGERLFNRTMTYCSAKDGWMIKGKNAASLFGISTSI